MNHKVGHRKLGKPTDQRLAMLRNLVTDLLNYESIRTTETRAKEVRCLAEKMITLGKKGTLHARRQAIAYLFSEKVADKVFADLGPRYAQRAGGYTRIIKLGQRVGDGAPSVVIELVK